MIRQRITSRESMEQKRSLRRQPDDHNFGSLDALRHGRRLPAAHLDSHEGTLLLSSRGSDPLNSDWQRHVLASTGYLELRMFDDAALIFQESRTTAINA
jgi:hypothetical protein